MPVSFYQYRQYRIRSIGPKIDLGCGDHCPAGYVGIDFKEHNQAIYWDVRDGIPLPDNSVTNIHTSHFVEHLTDSELANLWVEILRVCQLGAVIDIRCPHSSSVEACYHNHLSLWNEQKVKGVVAGFGSAPMVAKYGRSFKILHLNHEGMELAAKLEVHGTR